MWYVVASWVSAGVSAGVEQTSSAFTHACLLLKNSKFVDQICTPVFEKTSTCHGTPLLCMFLVARSPVFCSHVFFAAFGVPAGAIVVVVFFFFRFHSYWPFWIVFGCLFYMYLQIVFFCFFICWPSASHWIGKSLDWVSHIFAQDRKCYGGCSDCADDFLGRGSHFVLWNRFDEAHSGQGSRKASGEASAGF